MRVFTILKRMAHKLGLIGDYVVESGKSGIWTYQKWESGIVRLWGTYAGNIAAYTFSSWLVPVQKYPFNVYDAHDVACARVDTSGGMFVYGYDNNTTGWSGVVSTVDVNSAAYPTGKNARITAKIQIVGRWK